MTRILGFAILVAGTLHAAAAQDEPLPPGAILRIGASKFRHQLDIQMLVFSPDGKSLAAGGHYGLTVWELPTGKRRLRSLGCSGYVAFSPDGTLLASGGDGDTARVWDLATGTEFPRPDRKKDGPTMYMLSGMRRVTFSPDGKQLYSSAADGTVRILDAASGKELRIAKGPASFRPMAVVVVVNGRSCALSKSDGDQWTLWDLETGAEVLKIVGMTGYGLRGNSLDGTIIALSSFTRDQAGNHQYGMNLWDLALKKKILTLDHTKVIAFSRDGAMIATGQPNESAIRLREASTGKVIRTITFKRGSAGALAFSPDGKVLASATGQAIRLWDVATGQELPAAAGHDTTVSALAFSPDGKLLATTSGWNPDDFREVYEETADPIHVWDGATGRMIRMIEGACAPPDVLAFSPDGKQLAAAGRHFVGLWEVATSKPILTHEGQKKAPRTEWGDVPFTSIAFLVDGATLVAGDKDGTILFWKTATGEKIRSLEGEGITSLAFSPDGKLLALGMTDHTVRLRDGWGGREIWTISLPPNKERKRPTIRASFSPDGRVLAIEYSEGSGGLWEVATGKKFLDWDQSDGIKRISWTFSPDGATLVSTTRHDPAEISLWDATSLRKIRGFQASRSAEPGSRPMLREILPLAFSPDGKALAVAADDSSVLLWNVDPSTWPVYIQSRKENLDLKQLWEGLASKDAMAAHQAVLESAGQGGRAVAFLKGRLRPAAVDGARIRKLIADLDHEQMEARQVASTQIKAMDSAAEPLLREALAENPTGEFKMRLGELLESCEIPVTDLPESLRVQRSVWVLERIGTPEARALLDTLAQGPVGRLSRNARAALKRLKKN